MPKNVQVLSARELIEARRAKETPEKAEWTRRGATMKLCGKTEDGRIVETDFHISCELTEDGKFNTEAQNPMVIWTGDPSVRDRSWMKVLVKAGNGQKIIAKVDELFSTLIEGGLMDIHEGEKAKTPAMAGEGLDGPGESDKDDRPI